MNMDTDSMRTQTWTRTLRGGGMWTCEEEACGRRGDDDVDADADAEERRVDVRM